MTDSDVRCNMVDSVNQRPRKEEFYKQKCDHSVEKLKRMDIRDAELDSIVGLA